MTASRCILQYYCTGLGCCTRVVHTVTEESRDSLYFCNVVSFVLLSCRWQCTIQQYDRTLKPDTTVVARVYFTLFRPLFLGGSEGADYRTVAGGQL